MEPDSTQHKMLKAKKRRNLSPSVSSVTSSSSSSSNSSSSSEETSSSSSSSYDERKRRKKSKHLRNQKIKKKLVSGSESELDLSKELLPISGYIKTKDVMLEQMFKSISRKKLKAMLPDVLKSVPLNKLKKMCLDQLEVMSKKRIYRTLAGENPDAISSSGTDESCAAAVEEEEEAQVSTTINHDPSSPQKPDILRYTETTDQIILTDVTNIISGVVDGIEMGDNSNNNFNDVPTKPDDLVIAASEAARPMDESEDGSCDESIPSSLPDLVSEPEDGRGPFVTSDEDEDEEDSNDNNTASVGTPET